MAQLQTAGNQQDLITSVPRAVSASLDLLGPAMDALAAEGYAGCSDSADPPAAQQRAHELLGGTVDQLELLLKAHESYPVRSLPILPDDALARAALNVFRYSWPVLRRAISEFVGTRSIARRAEWGAIHPAGGEPWIPALPADSAWMDPTRAYNERFGDIAGFAASAFGFLAQISWPVRRRIADAPEFLEELVLCLLHQQDLWDYAMLVDNGRLDEVATDHYLGAALVDLARL